MEDFESALVARCNKSLKQLEKITEEFKLSRVSAERAATMGRAPPWLNGSTNTMRDWRSWVQFPWVTSTFNVDIA